MNPLLINLNGWEIPIIVLVILILFGGRKIPEFKKGLNDIEDDIKAGPSEHNSNSNGEK